MPSPNSGSTTSPEVTTPPSTTRGPSTATTRKPDQSNQVSDLATFSRVYSEFCVVSISSVSNWYSTIEFNRDNRRKWRVGYINNLVVREKYRDQKEISDSAEVTKNDGNFRAWPGSVTARGGAPIKL
ncbi:hypothetical protein DVH05_012913 [Phytophthora capsici]|nr:hypothetical protein DVH05_018328 [Phytophthora capsici]KAG1699501.1 hypothetical protein DVH05_012913 [Phytophthora capsici]